MTEKRAWFRQTFKSYSVPIDLDKDIEGSIRIQSRYLGNALVKSNPFDCFQALFYEITESELSEIIEDVDASIALPPKKRKRHRVIEYSVIFCVKQDEDDRTIINTREYYLFPREAIIESLVDTPPLEASVSFHLPITCSHRVRQKRRFTDPGLQLPSFFSAPSTLDPIVNLLLSGISSGLFMALKQHVSDFESVYGKMMELRTLHCRQTSVQRQSLALDEENIKFTKMVMHMAEEKKDATKQCLYCGSTSTPMWRRGPQGAGTLCNACGVKWKQGKILSEKKKPKEDTFYRHQRRHTADDLSFGLSLTTAEAAAVLTCLRKS
ncbi:uncharacterized protein B0P05DRAFT_588159 [Gilbertella persicaria]|uniref:uncharacterized protein n=1 Tax=Gilbertella persicaria TaxID=101096 RepID=UPI0022202124|nr:uncharacterized protein B0P05DRAFT_588159 [Gilbertella persicaria]KAI8076508.1 hypothetical protein B0P05DRAFT_588159 [Gilbertella persicaria]